MHHNYDDHEFQMYLPQAIPTIKQPIIICNHYWVSFWYVFGQSPLDIFCNLIWEAPHQCILDFINLKLMGMFIYSNVLVCNMQLLMSGVDYLYQDTNRLVSYEKNIAKQMQMKQQFIQKRVSQSSLVCKIL